MRLERGTAAAMALAAAAVLSGCAIPFGMEPPRKADTPPPVDPAVTAAVLLANRLELVQRLVEGAPTEQAQILATARLDYEKSPSTPSDELEYALVLAAPGHPGSDPAQAQQLLQSLLTSPVPLMPSERALAVLVLRDVDQQLDLIAENQRLQLNSQRTDHAQAVAASRRLQAETEENVRLRRELEKTRAQLSAIANIERSLNRRKSNAQAPSTQRQAPPGQAPQGQAPPGQAPQGQAPQGQTPQGQAPQGQAPQESAPQGPTTQAPTPQGQTQ